MAWCGYGYGYLRLRKENSVRGRLRGRGKKAANRQQGQTTVVHPTALAVLTVL
jgi:hypothetical protein